MPMGDVSPPEAAPNRRCQARPFCPPLRVLLWLVTRHSRNVVATHCGGVTLAASNWPMWISNLNYAPTAAAVPFYTCASLLAASPHVRSLPSLRWHTVDPRSGSLVPLDHAAPNSNTRDVILNGILDSCTL